MSDNKRIAKNTMFLYFRMILIMGVTFYMSRVVLDKLGVEDYGLYNVVGSIVGMLSFLNGTLSIGTMRFVTFELGRKDKNHLQITFNTAFYIHFALAILLALFLETIGLWYVYNKMVVPEERFSAAVIAYHISVLTSIVSITQVPYTSLIMAHERMSVYAYISILEAVAKLLVVYLLCISQYDRLILYAVLLAIVQIMVAMLYRMYCRRHFVESELKRLFDKNVSRSMMGFSGWNIMANLAETLNLQGIVVLINLFFAPYIVAAQAIANQISSAIMQFVDNFRTAINPQIIKLYAAGDRNESKKLTLDTTVFSFDLVLVIGLPAVVIMQKLMDVWLVEVPPYTVIFTQWTVIRLIINTFNASFYIPMMAANRMKINSIASVFSGIGRFALLYLLFTNGFGPMWIQYTGVLVTLIFSLIIKPYVLYKDIDYSIKEILLCVWTCTKVLLLSCCLSLPIMFLNDTFLHTALKVLITITAVLIASFVMMDKEMRIKCEKLMRDKIMGCIGYQHIS